MSGSEPSSLSPHAGPGSHPGGRGGTLREEPAMSLSLSLHLREGKPERE